MTIQINDLKVPNFLDFASEHLRDMSDAEIAQITGGVSFLFTFSRFDPDGSGFTKEITIDDDGISSIKTTTFNPDGSGSVSILE